MMSSSRPPSVADQVVLSDGYLSDSAMEQGKEKKKKKGPWRVSQLSLLLVLQNNL